MRSAFIIPAACAVLVLTPQALAQSFCLDDNPFIPMMGPVGPIPGYGAENPYGWNVPPWFAPGLAPSPSLGMIGCQDSDILGPGTWIQLPSPDGAYNDSLSNNTQDQLINTRLRFSVDRLSMGMPGTAVNTQAMLNQQPADIYLSTDYYFPPGFFTGMGGPPGYAGNTFAWIFGPTNNTLVYDDSFFPLLCGMAVIPPGAPAPPMMPGAPATHDNIDAFDRQVLDANGDMLTDGWMYFTLYPDEAMMVGPPASAADIYDVAPNMPGGVANMPFAVGPMMGLDVVGGPNSDSIDALIMYDNNIQGGPAWGGPGPEPTIDYALFSLAPGSVSLAQYGLDAADVFFTDFQGNFWLYAPAVSLGLRSLPGGEPGHNGDNVDALDPPLEPCPEDCDFATLGWPDGIVGVNDFLALLAQWGGGGTCDINGDGTINIQDFLLLIAAWGPCP
jgi:hypothetical protein